MPQVLTVWDDDYTKWDDGYTTWGQANIWNPEQPGATGIWNSQPDPDGLWVHQAEGSDPWQSND